MKYKVAIIFLGIKNAVNAFKIGVQVHHKMWRESGWDYPIEKRKISKDSERTEEQKKKLNELAKEQNDFILKLFDQNLFLLEKPVSKIGDPNTNKRKSRSNNQTKTLSRTKKKK